MSIEEATHLATRDRLALVFRLAGALLGLTVVVYAFATSSWSNPWVIGIFSGVTAGGALAYHLLTSIVRCPSCCASVSNFGITADARQKLFSCNVCGSISWLSEGFYWQD